MCMFFGLCACFCGFVFLFWKSAVVADILLQFSFCVYFLVLVHVFLVLYLYLGSQQLLLIFRCRSLCVYVFWF